MSRALARGSALVFGVLCLAVLLRALFPPALDPATPPPSCPIDQVCRFAPVKRAVIVPRILERWIALADGPQNVLAASSFSLVPVRMSAMERIFPGVSQIREMGRRNSGRDDPESHLLLAPDALILNAWQSEADEQLGLPVVKMDGTDASDEAMTRQWRRIAMLVGTTERTERLIAADAANRQAVVNETAALGEGTYRPRVLIARRNREGGVFWPISWHFLVAKQIPLLGAVDVTLSRPVRGAGLNQEELYVMDPDIIILPSWGEDGGNKDADPEDFYKDTELRSLAAVKHRRIYRSPLSWAEMGSPAERALMVRWMAEVMYPRQLQPRLRSLFRRSYQDVFGYAVSNDEIDDLLRLRRNTGSAGVERFAREAAAGGN